ncbi:MAG: hypothetical protein IKE58_00740 [Blautia sp.]|nr:hypothetical protein [Blautia sp.]
MTKEIIIAAFKDFFEKNNWHSTFDEEKSYFRCGVNIKCKLREVRLLIDVKDDAFLTYAVIPIAADKENPDEMLRYLSMANYGLKNGNFELDLRDGEIRYKVYENLDGFDTLPEQVVKDSIYIPVLMVEKYGDGIAALAMGFSDADSEYKKTQK